MLPKSNRSLILLKKPLDQNRLLRDQLRFLDLKKKTNKL